MLSGLIFLKLQLSNLSKNYEIIHDVQNPDKNISHSTFDWVKSLSFFFHFHTTCSKSNSLANVSMRWCFFSKVLPNILTCNRFSFINKIILLQRIDVYNFIYLSHPCNILKVHNSILYLMRRYCYLLYICYTELMLKSIQPFITNITKRAVTQIILKIIWIEVTLGLSYKNT